MRKSGKIILIQKKSDTEAAAVVSPATRRMNKWELILDEKETERERKEDCSIRLVLLFFFQHENVEASLLLFGLIESQGEGGREGAGERDIQKTGRRGTARQISAGYQGKEGTRDKRHAWWH